MTPFASVIVVLLLAFLAALFSFKGPTTQPNVLDNDRARYVPSSFSCQCLWRSFLINLCFGAIGINSCSLPSTSGITAPIIWIILNLIFCYIVSQCFHTDELAFLTGQEKKKIVIMVLVGIVLFIVSCIVNYTNIKTLNNNKNVDISKINKESMAISMP